MIEKLFGFLFQFKTVNFSEGNFIFQAGNAVYVFAGLFLLLATCFAFIYFITALYGSSRSRAFSLGLRIAALILLFIPLMEPTLMFPDIVPNENYLAVLIDNSASMSIPDGSMGKTRADDVKNILLDKKSGITPELEQNFNVRYYSFSDEAARADSIGNLVPDGRETNVTGALERVISDFKGLPLAGVVLLTDGGDNGTKDVRSAAEQLRSLDVPLHVVGLGKESLDQEREILDVTSNEELLENTGAEIEVRAKSWRDEKSPVAFNLFRGDRLVYTKEVTLRGNGNIDVFPLYYEPEQDESAEYTLQIAPAPDEANLENNTLDLLIHAKKDTVRVLYLEGYLRTDFKFIKRALESDPILDFSSATRTGTGKYYRQGIFSVDELKGGFPDSEEDLYGYKAVVFGDIEANYFSIEQLQMIERFVSRRGGGFLMLGGQNSFSEGNYQNTPIADILPVELDPGRKTIVAPTFKNPGIPDNEQGFKFVPTRAGLESPILKLSDDVSANRALWNDMPNLFTINYLGTVKPGATVLAEKQEDRFGGAEPLLVTQRYGKGRTSALATASTWRWQMLLDEKDSRHERFWRQFMRWLSTESPDRVTIEMTENRFEPGTEIPFRISVYDSTYNPLNTAEVSGIMTDPFGGVHEVQFVPELAEDGKYLSMVVLKDPGVYAMKVTARQNGNVIGTQDRSILSDRSKKEFYDAVLERQYLENLAELNGGFYYEPSQANTIPANLKQRRTSTSIFRYEYLWDVPLLFLLVVVLLSIEWVYRRNRGLP